MQPLQDQHILLGITGGIASYKSAALARRLIEAGADVRVVIDPGSTGFYQPVDLAGADRQPGTH